MNLVRWRRRIMWIVIVVGGMLLVGSGRWSALKENYSGSGSGSKQEKKQNTRAEHRGNLDRGSPLTRTIVYFRPQEQDEDSFDVMLRATAKTGKRDRFICTLRNVWLDELMFDGNIIPDAVGMLPSPTGEWLLLWDGGSQPYSSYHKEKATTEWSLIHLQDERRIKIAESQVDFWNGVSVIPSWANEFTVLFRDAEGKSSIDVRTPSIVHRLKPFAGTNSGAYPTGSEGSELLQYKEGSIHEGAVALRRIAPALDLKWNTWWSVHREEWALHLGLGVPLPHSAHGAYGPIVEASLSPDKSNMAVADRGIQKYVARKGPFKIAHGVRLRVVDLVSGKILFRYQAFPKAMEYPDGYPLSNPPRPYWSITCLEDLRWSPDGQYLSFTVYDDPQYKHEIPAVHIIDVQTWKETLCIPNAINAFILPDSARRN